MSLPEYGQTRGPINQTGVFTFSQQSLQDYVDCARRFQLRYLLHVTWPAVQAEPVLEHERHLQRGLTFHRLVHQHVLGVPEERLSRMVADDDDLARWWHNYLTYRPATLPPRQGSHEPVTNLGARGSAPQQDSPTVELPHVVYPEITLSAAFGDYRLMAKYDLLVRHPSAYVVILDWKTSQRRTRREYLAARLQTRVYRYLLVRAGRHLLTSDVDAPEADSQVPPEKVAMIYWFAEFPASPERFPYDAEQYAEDEAYLTRLIAEIESRAAEVPPPAKVTPAGIAATLLDLGEAFPMTEDARRCNYCPYRSLCDRGVGAADFTETEEELAQPETPGTDFDIDFEQIAEIAF
jgi:hypothetical protein